MKSKKSEIRITNNFNAPIGQHIDHVDTINFRMDGDGQFHFGMVETVSDEQTAQAAATAQESGASVQATVAGAGEEKRKALMAANIVIRTQKNSGQQTVDILKLYRFVDEYFVSEIKHKYEWYALRRFLERYSLLKNCDNEQFAAQMNSKEWFAHSKHSCEANEMNYYNYLNSLQPEQWLDKDVQLGSRATKRSVANIYRTHANLELYKDLLIG